MQKICMGAYSYWCLCFCISEKFALKMSKKMPQKKCNRTETLEAAKEREILHFLSAMC